MSVGIFQRAKCGADGEGAAFDESERDMSGIVWSGAGEDTECSRAECWGKGEDGLHCRSGRHSSQCQGWKSVSVEDVHVHVKVK